MKKFISTVLALGMAASLAACGGSASTAASTESTAASAAEATADSDLAYIKNKGKMTIGYTVYEPMNYTDADGNFTGFDTELATAVCEKLGVEPDFVEINWDTKIVELDAKSIDCIWNGMTLTDDIGQHRLHEGLCQERAGRRHEGRCRLQLHRRPCRQDHRGRGRFRR